MCKNGNNGNGNGNGSGGELTGLQRAFVDEWFKCKFNATEAAKRAGYQGDRETLASMGSANLRKHKIREAIDERWAKRGATPGEVAARFTDWMRFDASVLFNEHGLLDWARVKKHGNMIKKFTWDKGHKLTVEVHDQMKAAELMARTMGMFMDKSEVEHTGEVVVRFAKPEEYID